MYSYGKQILAERKWKIIEGRAPAATRHLVIVFVEALVVLTLFVCIGIEVASGMNAFLPK